MESLDLDDSKTCLSRLQERADLEEGKAEARRPGLLEGQVGEAFFDPLPETELEAWEH
jgi:hypothetical protein